MRIAVLLLALCCAGVAHAGAWTKSAGGGYLKLGSATFLSDHGYDLRGDVVESDSFLLRAQTLYGYAELGLSDDVTLLAYLPYLIATNQHTSGVSFHALGLSDAQAGIQLRLFAWRNLVASARFEAKVPLYQGAPTIRGRQTAKVPGFPRSATYFPALGDGQVDLSGFLSAGASLPRLVWFDAFVTMDVGYRLRTGAITDAVVLNLTAGVWLLPGHLVVMANSSWVATLPSEDELRISVGKGYWAVGPSLLVPVFAGLSLEVGAELVTRGVNAAGGGQLLFGVSYAF